MRAVKEVMDKGGVPRSAGGTGGESGGPIGKVTGYPGRARQFLHDVRLEMRNVTWPTFKDVQATTMVVLIATFFFGFYLGLALDVPIARVMTWLLQMGRTLVG
jgi:preprotein translocase subunit SecE